MSESFKCLMRKTFKYSLLLFVLQLVVFLILLMGLSCLGVDRLPEPANTISNIIVSINLVFLMVSPVLGWYDEMVVGIKEFLETDC